MAISPSQNKEDHPSLANIVPMLIFFMQNDLVLLNYILAIRSILGNQNSPIWKT
jgi:hypothetical protein